MELYKLFPIQNEVVAYFIPVFLILIALESYASFKLQNEYYQGKDTAASLSMGVGSVIINMLMKGLAYGVFSILYTHRIFDLGWHWWVWVLAFFVEDFTFYWHHRLSHEIRILWAAHVNHHSSEKLNLGTALRQSWAELFYKYFFWLWLPLIGFPPLMILMLMSFSLVFQFFPHTEYVKKFPFWIEFFFNTPSHHRVHHASNIRYLDSNHAGILIIWDKIFGTFSPELATEKPIYGITKNIETFNPFKIATHEFAAIWADMKSTSNWSEKLKYLYKSPGWSHNGEDLTAKTLKQKLSTP